jgi:hypothetical protein
MIRYLIAVLVCGCGVDSNDTVSSVGTSILSSNSDPATRVITPSLSTSLPAPPGSLINQQILTGVGVYVPTPGTTMVHVRQQAAGGGGGGVGGTGFGVGAAGGGNSGFYLEYTIELASGGPYDTGIGGAGGTVVPTAGGTGGDNTLVLNNTTFRAKGGTGGGLALKAPSGVTGPALPSMGSTLTPVILYGEGGLGFWSGPTAAASGRGGSSPLGFGGVAVGVGSGGSAGERGGGGSGGASATSIVGGPGGDGIIIVDEYTTASLTRTPNGCTDVTMTSPAAPFALALGESLSLSATATCPSGQVPEFQFRVKRVRDASFDTVMLGGYRSSSNATFTPPTPDAWCVGVAVRAVGALEASQAIAPAVCGTVGASGSDPDITTLSLPMSPPGERIPTSVVVSRSKDSGVFETPITLPLGTHIVQLRAVGIDNLDGQSSFIVGLRRSDATGNSFIVGAGPPSKGTGTYQTVVSETIDETVLPGLNYGCDVVLVSGTGSVALHSCEVDTIRP